MDNKISIKIVSDWPEKFGGAYVSAFVELTQRDNRDSRFCGNPNLMLMHWSADNRIRLTLGDEDDMDLAKMYHPKNSAEAAYVFHKLMCFMESIAESVVDSTELLNEAYSGDLFPKIDGVEMMWEWEEES